MLAPLLQLVSPQLPIGGYSYSRGLELAVERGWVSNLDQASAWIGGLFEGGAKNVDAPIVARFFDAWATASVDRVQELVELDLALRETREMRAESIAMGSALTRLLHSLDPLPPAEKAASRGSYHSAFALAAHRWGLDRRHATAAFLWTWLESTIMAAVKLVPLGQTDGQRLLQRYGKALESAVDHALGLEDDAIGALQPGLAIASSLHESQHTRLFRS